MISFFGNSKSYFFYQDSHFRSNQTYIFNIQIKICCQQKNEERKENADNTINKMILNGIQRTKKKIVEKNADGLT